MNHVLPVLCLLSALAAGLQAEVRTSVSYSILTDVTDSAGGRAASALYADDASLGGVTGIATVTSPAETDKGGYIAQLTDDGPPVLQPEIAVEQPAGTNLPDGGSRSFGNVAAGSNASLTFTVRNAGTANLTGLGITINGPDAVMFSVTSGPTAPVAAGGTTTFTVRFTPSGAGARNAALHIASNDSDENPFDINVSGTGLTASASFRITTIRQTGAGGRDVELKFNSENGATYRVSKSLSMAAGTWTDAGVSASGNGTEQIITLPGAGLGARQFFRIVKQ